MNARIALQIPFVLVAAVAWADDTRPAAELHVPSRWTAGETVTEAETIETTSTMRMTMPNGSVREMPAGVTSQKSTVVRKCLELGEDGLPSKMLLYVKEWRMQGGGPEDSSLQDVVLELRRDGWKLLTPDFELTPRARAWLVGDLLTPEASGEARAMDFLPQGDAALGQEWKPASVGSISHLLRRLDIDPKASGAETTCKLTSLAHADGGTSVRVEYETIAESAAPGGDAAAKKTPNKAHITGFVAGVAGAWHRTLSSSMETDVELALESQGRSMLVSSHAVSTSVHTPGGEIRSWEPEAPDEDAVLCTFATARAKAGDVVTEDGSDEFTVTTRAEDCSCAPCPTPEATRSTEWTLVRRTEAVGEDGRESRERVFVRTWTHTENGKTDTSLAGAAFDVTAEGWRIAGDAALSPAASRWVKTRAPAGRDPVAPFAPAPSAPSRAGTLWLADTSAVAKLGLWDDGFVLRPEHATGRCKIVEANDDADGVVAKVRYHTETPLDGTVGEGDKRVTALAGSEVEVSGNASGPVAAWGRLGERRTQMECSVLVQRGAAIGRLATIHKLWLEVKAGGEFPAESK